MEDEARARAKSTAPQFDGVALGASAGGGDALHPAVAALPLQFPATVLIEQHVDPGHNSMLAGLLGRRCELNVRQAVLADTKLVPFSRPSIDLLSESVADEYGDRVTLSLEEIGLAIVSLVLPGSGDDQ